RNRTAAPLGCTAAQCSRLRLTLSVAWLRDWDCTAAQLLRLCQCFKISKFWCQIST
ncbi:hypothetical protein TorRG33x02_013020, partial [Trema orientale]